MIMRWIFLLYIILNPLFCIAGVEARQVQEFFFQVSSIVLILCAQVLGEKNIKFNKFNLSIIILPLWFLIVFLVHNIGWSIALNLLLATLVYFSAIRSLKKEDIRFLINGVLIIGALGIAYLALQYFGYDPRDQKLRNVGSVPHCSFFFLEAAMGMYFALLIPLLLSFGIIGLIAGFLVFIPLVFSWSTAAYLGAVISTMFFLWFKKRKIFWFFLLPVMIVFSCFVFLIDAPMGMFKSRLPMWGLVIQDINKSPVFGYGLDSFRNSPKDNSLRYFKHSDSNTTVRAKNIGGDLFIDEKAPANVIENMRNGKNPLDFWDNAHNTFIHYAYETGLLFLLIIGFGFHCFWLRFKKSKRSAETVALFSCLLAFMIFSLTQFPFNLARIGHLFPVLLGLFYISTEENVT